jgi:cell division initiation protein
MMPEFNTEMRGYNKQEVDEYFQQMRSEYAEVCTHLQEKIQTLESSAQSQEDVSRAMLLAQSVVKKIEEEAISQKEEIIRQAEQQARNLMQEARADAMAVVNQAAKKYREIQGKLWQVCDSFILFMKEADLETKETDLEMWEPDMEIKTPEALENNAPNETETLENSA